MRAAQRRSPLRFQHPQRALQVMHALRHRLVFEQRTDILASAKRSSAESRIRGNAQPVNCAAGTSAAFVLRSLNRSRRHLFSSGSRSSIASVSCSATCSAAASRSRYSPQAQSHPARAARAKLRNLLLRRLKNMLERLLHLRRRQLLQQRRELELREQRAAGIRIRWLRPHLLQIKLASEPRSGSSPAPCSAESCRDCFRATRDIVFPFTSLARSSAASTLPNCWISSTEPLSPIPGAPGMLSIESPRSAITSITRSGGTPSVSITFSRSSTRLSFTGFSTFTLLGHQLQHVLVVRDDIHRMPRLRSLRCQRADHVVGLKALRLQDRNMKRLQRAPDIRQLLRQVRRHLGAVGLVAAVVHLFEGLRLDVELAHASSSRARSSRKTGPLTSKTAAKYSGEKSLRSLLIMFTKT